MEGKFNSKEQFELVLYNTIKKTGEINLGKFMGLVESEDKDKIKELYDTEKVGIKIIDILKANPEKYIFTSTKDSNKNFWSFKVVDNDNTNTKKDEKESSAENKIIIEKEDVQDINVSNTMDIPQQEEESKNLITLQEEDDDLPNSDESSTPVNKKRSLIDKKLKENVIKDMVLINNSFYISKYLVTQELYEAVMGKNPSTFKDNPDTNEKQERRPVETVSYLEAIDFCEKLSEKCGFSSCYLNGNYLSKSNGFRLPTEDEWNFVAKAENKNSYKYAGSNSLYGIAWFKHNSKIKTHEVGKKKPVMINDTEGIYDMNGNVCEWVMSNKTTEKGLFIGGSYKDSEDYLELGKPINKEFKDKNTKDSKIGFRICVNSVK